MSAQSDDGESSCNSWPRAGTPASQRIRETSTALIEYFEHSGTRPIVVASFPRSGTHLMIDSLRLNFVECATSKRLGESVHRMYFDLDRAAHYTPATAVRAARRTGRLIIKTHATATMDDCALPVSHPYDPLLIDWLGQNAEFIYMYRDGRDCLVSLQELMSGWSPEAMTSFPKRCV